MHIITCFLQIETDVCLFSPMGGRGAVYDVKGQDAIHFTLMN